LLQNYRDYQNGVFFFAVYFGGLDPFDLDLEVSTSSINKSERKGKNK